MRLMGANDVWVYIHGLTHIMTGLRPDGYEDAEEANKSIDGAGNVNADPSCGVKRVCSIDLLDSLDEIFEEGSKTPLILDSSKEGVLRDFFAVKGKICDLSPLGLSLSAQRKAGVKVKEVLERARKSIVAALSGGLLLAVYIGDMGERKHFHRTEIM